MNKENCITVGSNVMVGKFPCKVISIVEDNGITYYEVKPLEFETFSRFVTKVDIAEAGNMNVSKKVEMYLKLQGRKIEDFDVEIETDDGEFYYTDNIKDFRGNVLAIRNDGQEFDWFPSF